MYLLMRKFRYGTDAVVIHINRLEINGKILGLCHVAFKLQGHWHTFESGLWTFVVKMRTYIVI